MSDSPNDPKRNDPKTDVNRNGDSSVETAGNSAREAPRAAKALPYLAAIAAASVAQASASVPAPELDRAYLEALLHGSWTRPPDLSERRPSATDAVELAGTFEQTFGGGALEDGFNDTYNPHPTPYSDKTYADSGFGDRTN